MRLLGTFVALLCGCNLLVGAEDIEPQGDGSASDSGTVDGRLVDGAVADARLDAATIDAPWLPDAPLVDSGPDADLPDAGLLGDVGEAAVALVAIQPVRLAVAGVEGRRNVQARLEVAADVQVEVAVVVDVAPRGDRGAAVLTDSRLCSGVREGAITVGAEELVGLEGAGDEHVFVAVVVEIGE